METILYVDNLKCGGCANTISKAVSAFKNIESVEVHTENGEIKIFHQNNIDIPSIKQKLHDIGYPEQASTKGLYTITCNIKSYVSCAIGKISSGDNKDDKSQL